MRADGAKQLEGWRDPFVFQTKNASGHTHFQMVLGTGTKDRAGECRGAIMHYAAPALEGPWSYKGLVAEEAQGSLHDLGSTEDPCTGRVWECPALLQVPTLCFH